MQYLKLPLQVKLKLKFYFTKYSRKTLKQNKILKSNVLQTRLMCSHFCSENIYIKDFLIFKLLVFCVDSCSEWGHQFSIIDLLQSDLFHLFYCKILIVDKLLSLHQYLDRTILSQYPDVFTINYSIDENLSII
jgi:hypothetical protein